MTRLAVTTLRRRGACPGLSAPMPTGDGLLVRLLPIGGISLPAFAAMCRAARKHGNGVIEITSRGSIQVRGLSVDSTPRFAAEIGALGIAAADGVPVLCNALAGLDAGEILDAGARAAELRRALAHTSLPARLGAKVSVIIDGGGVPGLDPVAADIRLRAEAMNGGTAYRLSVGGDDVSAAALGVVAAEHGIAAAIRLLDVLAKHGRDARARDVLVTEGIAAFRAAIADLFMPFARPRESRGPALDSRLRGTERSAPIGIHPLRDGSLACGVGLAFGHADAASLEGLVDVAGAAGATELRAASGRALMTIGLAPETAEAFVAAAEKLGFIVRAGDQRRNVVACAGAPICASAHIAARALAPDVAARAAPYGDGTSIIHISGCAKGCAHAAPAALTVVGTAGGCALIAHGSASDAPFAVVPVNDLPATIARYAREPQHEAGHV
jgi:precorrin-3B synthase